MSQPTPSMDAANIPSHHFRILTVSEGIVAYRIAHGLLPESDSRIIDVGPSYVVVAAIAIAVLYGSWPARIAAAVDLLLLIFVGGIFSGLSTLQVAAVGHMTSILVAAILGSTLAWRLRRAQSAASIKSPASNTRRHLRSVSSCSERLVAFYRLLYL